MKRALFVMFGLMVAGALAQDKPVPERGDALARLSVPGMQCEGACPPTIKAALLDGPGAKDATVDFAKKVVTLRFDATRTHASDALARLVRMKPYASSQLLSLEAVFESDYARATATATAPKRGTKARLRLTLEPRPGHSWNTERNAADLEVEVLALPAGLKAHEPLTKVKGGLKAARTFDIDLDVDPKARPGEVTVSIEVRLEDTQGKDVKAHAIALAVPLLVP